MKIKLLGAAVAAAFILTGCSGSDEPAPTVTVTATPSASPSTSDLTNLGLEALEQVWNSMSEQKQVAICVSVRLAPDSFYEGFVKGAGEYANVLTREEVFAFFDTKCGVV